MTPSGRSAAKSSASDAYSGTPRAFATSAASGEMSTIEASAVASPATISSICRRPIAPAPATAMRTLLTAVPLPL